MTAMTLASTQNFMFKVTLEQISETDYRIQVTAFDKCLKNRQKMIDYRNLGEAYRIYGAYVEDLVSRERTFMRQEKAPLAEIELSTTQLWFEQHSCRGNPV